MAAEPQRNRLPFEPSKKRQKQDLDSKKEPETVKKLDKQQQNSKNSDDKSRDTKKPGKTAQITKEEIAVPKVVSDRMVRRMTLFCGIPTVLAMATIVTSYIIFSYGRYKLPNVLVLLVSTGFFGLGVLGLSYGVISASWDEERVGSKLGWQEFTTNWGRLRSAWRSNRQKNM